MLIQCANLRITEKQGFSVQPWLSHSVDQAGLEPRDPPASAAQALGLMEGATITLALYEGLVT